MKNTPTTTTTYATTTATTTTVRTARATQTQSTREAVSIPTTTTTTTTTSSPKTINGSSTAFIDVNVPKFAKQVEGEILVPLPLPPPIANFESDDDFPDAGPPPPDAGGGGGGLVGIITSLSGVSCGKVPFKTFKFCILEQILDCQFLKIFRARVARISVH